MVRLNPHLRQNYSIFMRNFKQNQHKLSNNHVQFSNRNLLCKFEPPSNPGSAPASTIYFILFTWASPYGTHMEPGCTAHMGPIRVPTWDPYGFHIDCLLGFLNARFLRSLSVPGGGGGESLFVFCMRRLEPSIYLSPPKISGISSTQIFFTRSYVCMKISEYPPPLPSPRECSCIVIPGAPVSQIKLA